MTTSAQDTEALMQRAKNDYAEHVIVQSSADRWKLKRPGTGDLWAEVAVLAKGTLLVHGDRDPILFGHLADYDRPSDVVHWMARPRPDTGNFVVKASVAMGMTEGLIWRPSMKLFLEELHAVIDGLDEEEHEHREALQEIVLQTTDMENEDDDYLIEGFKLDIYNTAPYDIDGMPKGRVISHRMVHAWAIIQRLSQLLKEQPLDVPPTDKLWPSDEEISKMTTERIEGKLVAELERHSSVMEQLKAELSKRGHE